MGFWDWLGFGKRKKQEKEISFEFALAFINSIEMQNEALKRTGFYSMYANGGTMDIIPNAYGEFGRTPTNPIPVNGSYGEITYLSRLRVKDTGSIVVFHRLGSFGTNEVCKHPVDGFELVSLDGKFRDKLFLDMYHLGQSTKLPDGYAKLEVLKGLTGVPESISDFPLGIYDAVVNYSKQVLGVPIVMTEIQNITETSLQHDKTELKQQHYFIERPEESKDYLQSWAIAGAYLQTMFNKNNQEFSDEHMGFCWLRTDITNPTFDSMNFRYKNKVFSVLLELVIPVDKEALLTKTTRHMKKLQVDICKENDMIPCLFPVEIDKMKPHESGWNLRNTETGEVVIPTEMADDSPKPVSMWELMNWGISIVMKDLQNNGNKILSFTDAPGIMPQIWFENNNGEKCWVQVFVNKPMELIDFSDTIAGSYKGFLASVTIQALTDDILYRSHPANVKYDGLKAI